MNPSPLSLPTVPYASPYSDNERRGYHLVHSYLAGLLVSALGWTGFLLHALVNHVPHPIAQVCLIFSLFLGGAFLAATSLSFVLWFKLRSGRQVRYGHTLLMFFAGTVAGLVPLFLWSPNGFLLFHLIFAFIAAWIFCRSNPLKSECDSPLRLRYQKWSVVFASISACLFLTGYISSAVSRAKCERQVGHLIAMHIHGESIHPRGSDSARILAVSGVAMLAPFRDSRTDSPWAEITSDHIESPFIVTIKWGWRSDSDAEGGETQFICVFGYTFSLGDRIYWIA